MKKPSEEVHRRFVNSLVAKGEVTAEVLQSELVSANAEWYRMGGTEDFDEKMIQKMLKERGLLK